MSSRDLLMSANVTFWMADAGRSSQTDQGRGADFDSYGNVYVAGYPSTTGTLRDPWFVAKYAPDGSLIWQKSILGSGTATQTPDDQPLSLVVNGSNIYVYGFLDRNLCVLKLDLDGNVVWRSGLVVFGLGSGSNSFAGDSVAVDQSGNVYIAFNNGSDWVIAKFNSSGVLQFQNAVRNTAGDPINIASLSITQPSSGYAITQRLFVHVNQFNTFTNNPTNRLITLDLNGAVITSRTDSFTAPELVYASGAMALGPTSTVFSTFSTNAGVAYIDLPGSWVSKISGLPSATILGTLGGIAGSEYLSTLYLYTCFCVSNVMYIFKHNSLGTLMWQRSISLAPGFTLEAKRVRADNYGNVYFVGSSSVVEQSASTNLFFGKIPSDGSLTGTYMLGASPDGYVIYAATALSTTSTTSIVSALAYSSPTPTYAAVTPSTTSSAATFSSTTVII